MKIIGIIPARYNSTRLPGKPLIEIEGKSMIQRVYEQAQKVKSFVKIIVATDDKRIFDHVENFDGNVIMTSNTHQSGTDRCGEVINTLYDEYDVAVNIQGDEPFIHPVQLENLIAVFNESQIEIATLSRQIPSDEKSNHQMEASDENVVKVVFDNNNNALYFSRSAIPFKRNNNPEITYFKHIGIYAYRSDILKQIIQLPQSRLEKAESLEQLRWLENGFKLRIVETDIDTIGIDTLDDLKKIKSLKPEK
ncbi:MAG: 3-deoxy-manno-octulosonate cytidylyltransferase [Fimbriimonadaceae bacterium]|nr:3-deoxy-manno-octulosonate cytidylyltransferase [Chitinophagales bacterium]